MVVAEFLPTLISRNCSEGHPGVIAGLRTDEVVFCGFHAVVVVFLLNYRENTAFSSFCV